MSILSPSPPILSLPSQRLINEAATIVYRRWRKLGLSHDGAVEQAALFALSFASKAAQWKGGLRSDASNSRACPESRDDRI